MALVRPVTLRGDLVVLSPLRLEDHDELVQAVDDGRLWELTYTSIPSPSHMRAEIERRLRLQAADVMLPFTARDAGGRVIGMTTFMAIDEANRRLEIGSTWNALSAQRSGTNTESKLLMLQHAFEDVGVIAVEFRTHWLNLQSRAAIERLGAKMDGVLRSHMIAPDGSVRDTVVYSIIGSEWPAIKAELRRKLTARGSVGS